MFDGAFRRRAPVTSPSGHREHTVPHGLVAHADLLAEAQLEGERGRAGVPGWHGSSLP